jgi:hypothetical protein
MLPLDAEQLVLLASMNLALPESTASEMSHLALEQEPLLLLPILLLPILLLLLPILLLPPHPVPSLGFGIGLGRAELFPLLPELIGELHLADM